MLWTIKVPGILLTFIPISVIIVACETVAHATIIFSMRYDMPKFMKMLNNISRSQAIYRNFKIAAEDLQSGHYAFVLAICREPGRSQEELAKELCINKSTVARNLNCLEEKGYITRVSLMSTLSPETSIPSPTTSGNSRSIPPPKCWTCFPASKAHPGNGWSFWPTVFHRMSFRYSIRCWSACRHGQEKL